MVNCYKIILVTQDKCRFKYSLLYVQRWHTYYPKFPELYSRR